MYNYNPTFIGDIDLNEDTLAHFGIKGMKWHVIKRKIKDKITKRKRKSAINYNKDKRFQRQSNGINVMNDNRYIPRNRTNERHARWIGSHIGDHARTGKYTPVEFRGSGNSDFKRTYNETSANVDLASIDPGNREPITSRELWRSAQASYQRKKKK